MRILWADDDIDNLLGPCADYVEHSLRHGNGNVQIDRTKNFESAIENLQRARGVDNREFKSLLADILLPHARGHGMLGSSLGLRLARMAIDLGVANIAFLTVVPLDEVRIPYDQLRATFPGVRFGYFDKTRLLEAGEITGLIEHLIAGGESPVPGEIP